MTVLGVARRGYFIPYRYAAEMPEPGSVKRYEGIEAVFEARKHHFFELLAGIEADSAALEAIAGGPGNQPRWDQGWFARLDAAAAYAMVRRQCPGRIVEVGSGHSTRFLSRAVRDGDLDTRIVAIDPAPRASTTGIGVDHIACKAHEADLELFMSLRRGDILFIDSSHILMPGSDVDFLINRVWPALANGVVVHFHDIFLPDDYPSTWSWRGYNEQLAVAPLLTSHAADILFASHYVATRMGEALRRSVLARLPLIQGAVESSLWLEKRACDTEAAKP